MIEKISDRLNYIITFNIWCRLYAYFRRMQNILRPEIDLKIFYANAV